MIFSVKNIFLPAAFAVVLPLHILIVVFCLFVIDITLALLAKNFTVSKLKAL